jgi:hypothetical protein
VMRSHKNHDYRQKPTFLKKKRAASLSFPRGIIIPMQDPIIHTDAHPVCDDVSCPCRGSGSHRQAES